jgi:hypothetical protein
MKSSLVLVLVLVLERRCCTLAQLRPQTLARSMGNCTRIGPALFLEDEDE